MAKTMLEYLEQDRERLLGELEREETLEGTIPVLERELDRILYQYNEDCEIEPVRAQASQMIQAARISLPLLDSAGETKIWEDRSLPAASGAGAVGSVGRGKILLGVSCGLAAASWALGTFLGGAGALACAPWTLLLMAGGMTACYFAGRGSRSLDGSGRMPAFLFHRQMALPQPENQKADYGKLKTQTLPNAQHIYRSLRGVLILIDRNLTALSQSEKWRSARQLAGGNAGRIPDQLTGGVDGKGDFAAGELDLFMDLLEASCSRDGGYALEKTAQVRHYLYSRGIEVVDYSADIPADWFEHMPSAQKETVTIRPALVRGGRVLRRGIVSG